MRGIGKFNNRHLWSNTEIAKAEPKVIWELLDDIWHYYTSKNIPSNEAKIKKSQSFKNIKAKEIKTNLNNSSDDIHTPKPEHNKYVENYYSVNKLKVFQKYTDLMNYQKMLSSNINQAISLNKNESKCDKGVLEECLGIKKKKKIKYIILIKSF